MAKNGTEVEVSKLPDCDVCKINAGKATPAAYDARTHFGQWGYLCEEHFGTHTSGKLGTGIGQRLILAKS